MSCWDLPFTACVKTHAKLQHDQRTVSFSIHLGQSTLHHTKLFSNVHSLNKIFLYVRNQASLSVEFSRQAYWSELPFHSPGDVPDPGIEPRSPALQADSLLSEPQGIDAFRLWCWRSLLRVPWNARKFSKQSILLLSHFSRVQLCVIPQTAATRLPRPWDSPGKNTGV